MWMWILIGLNIITKANGYVNRVPDTSCESMAVVHRADNFIFHPQTNKSPFEVDYKHGKEGEPITVFLRRKQSTTFRGFMLEAREKDKDNNLPVGRFILLDTNSAQLMTCNDLPNSAVTHRNNQEKTLVQVNWTADGAELSIFFRTTFVESFDVFWENVDVNVTLPLYTTSTTAGTTEPSTTTSTTKPSTTAGTTEPSTTTSTTKPSTTAGTTEPSTTTSTTKPSTTAGTTEPSTTTSTTKPSTTAGTTEPSTTTSTTKPSTTAGTTEPNIMTTLCCTTTSFIPSRKIKYNQTCNLCKAAGISLNAFNNFLDQVKMVIHNIATVTLSNSPACQCLNKVTKILCCLLCAVAEISALVLFCVDDAGNVTVALVSVVTVIDLIELVIVCLPIGPSNELNGIFDLILKVCTVICEIFTIAVIFTSVLEDFGKSSWYLKVMKAYTVWIFLFVIWVLIASIHRKKKTRKIGEGWRNKTKKKKLSTEVIVIAASLILAIGTMLFAIALTFGALRGQ
ncbi:hypothetical protein PAMA_001489 [Pampus argenteus]